MRKLLSALLALALCAGMLPLTQAAIGWSQAEASQSETAQEAPEADGVIVRYEEEALPDAVIEEQASVSVESQELLGESEKSRSETVVVKLKDGEDAEEAASAIANMEGVASAEPNYRFSVMANPTNDTYCRPYSNTEPVYNQQYLWDMKVTEAWNLTHCDKTISVAVMDTGCNLSHPDLKGIVNSGLAYDATEGMKLASRNLPNNGDIEGHGTAVCGCVAAQASNGLGIAGSSYNASVIPIKVFSDGGDCYLRDLLDGYKYLKRLIDSGKVSNLRVINLSIGVFKPFTGIDAMPTLHDAISEMNDKYGVLTVVAGGNGTGGSPYSGGFNYPSDYDECLAVTSVNSKGYNSTWSDYNQFKDLSAPGENILTTSKNGAYDTETGTSFSAPLVSGIAALLWSTNPALTPAKIRSVLKETATPVKGNFHPSSGSTGIVDAQAALTMLGVKTRVVPSSSCTVSVSSTQKTFTIKASGGKFASASKVQFAVWSKNGGQDDVRWYTATGLNGIWSYKGSVSNHKDYGTYNVRAYATVGGTRSLVSSKTFSIKAPTASSLKFTQTASQKKASKFKVTLSGITAASGVKKVQIRVWNTKNGTDDAVTYTATKNGKSYYVMVPMYGTKRGSGTYKAQAYVTCGNGIRKSVKTASKKMTLPKASIKATVSKSKKTATITATGGAFATASKVYLPTWSTKGGQDDIRWYEAKKSGNSWKVTISLTRHNTYGKYVVHGYVKSGSKQKYVCAASFKR